MLKTVFILILTATVVYAPHPPRSCPDYCADCDSQLKCYTCFSSYWSNFQCNKSPRTGKCLIFNSNNQCYQCPEGYSQKLFAWAKKEQPPYCYPINNIPHCVIAYNKSNDPQDQICVACDNGYPSQKDGKSCIPAKIMPNCRWGGRDYQKSRTYCYRCNPGYATVLGQNGCLQSFTNNCYLQGENRICMTCDMFDGYFKNTPYDCRNTINESISSE